MKLYKRGKTWYVDAREEGGGRVSTGCTDYDKARTAAKRMLKGRGTGHTLESATARAYAEHYAGTKSERNVVSQMSRLNAAYGDVKVADIDTPMVKDWTASLRQTGMADKTINRYLALISKVLKLSCEWGWLDTVPYMPRLKEAKGRIRSLTASEEQGMWSLFEAHPDHWWMNGLTAFLLDTGCRLSEALDVPAADRVSAMESGKWTIWVNKGDRPRTIPLTARAMDAMTVWGWEGKTARQAQDAWAWARDELGLQGDKQFVIHCLRHTCATRLVSQDVPLSVIRDYLGHATVAVTEKYAHLNPRALEVAALCLETVPRDGYDASAGSLEARYQAVLKENQRLIETVNLTAQPSEVQILPPPPSLSSDTYDDILETTYW